MELKKINDRLLAPGNPNNTGLTIHAFSESSRYLQLPCLSNGTEARSLAIAHAKAAVRESSKNSGPHSPACQTKDHSGARAFYCIEELCR